jgi:hypothetical protein
VAELFQKNGYPVTVIEEQVVEDETLYVLRMTGTC